MFDFLTYIPLIGDFLSVLVPFIIALSVVIFVHEYGHYIVGRLCGIHAEAFSIGFGRVLASWHDKRGTKWQIAALPLGGYVKFLGDANSASATADKAATEALPKDLQGRTFHGARLYKKSLTIIAGPGVNFVFSFVVFSLLTWGSGIPTDNPVVGELRQFPGIENQLQTGDLIKSINGTEVSNRSDFDVFLKIDTSTSVNTYVVVRDGREMTIQGPYPWLPIVTGVVPATPAARAGLQAGDLILKVGDVPVNSFLDLQKIIRASEEARVPLLVQRGDKQLVLTIKPRKSAYEKEDGSFGERIQIGVRGSIAFGPEIVKVSVGDALYYGYRNVAYIVERFVNTIGELVTGGLSPKNLQGPLGIAVASGDTASQGFAEFVFFVGFISTAIGLMNLLPIPILDGGHLLIFAYQAVFRRKPNEKVLQFVMLLGFSFLIMIVLYATFYDGVRLFG